MTAGITAGASVACAELLSDLKAGYLLGASPRKQFVAQLVGTASGAVSTALAFTLLVPDARALLGDGLHPPSFAAPAAHQYRAVAELFRAGIDNLHSMCRLGLLGGLAVGGGLAVVERALSSRGKRWLPSPAALGLGLMLSFSASLSVFLGGALAAAWTRSHPRSANALLPVTAAGGLAGESIVGVVVQVRNTLLL